MHEYSCGCSHTLSFLLYHFSFMFHNKRRQYHLVHSVCARQKKKKKRNSLEEFVPGVHITHFPPYTVTVSDGVSRPELMPRQKQFDLIYSFHIYFAEQHLTISSPVFNFVPTASLPSVLKHLHPNKRSYSLLC